MNIQQVIDTLLVNTEEIQKAFPTVTNVRHEIKDIPYSELLEFARFHKKSIHTDETEKRAYVIHNPIINGKMDTDIWLYSTIVTIKPAEIIAD